MLRNLTPGTLSVGILAILMGLVAAYSIRTAMLGDRTKPVEPEKSVEVPLASANLPTGRPIVLEDISIVRMTRSEFLNKDWPMDQVMMTPQQIIDRVLRRPIVSGSPFLTSDFYLKGSGPGINIKPGTRAVSLQVPFERGGYVTPGELVDVLFRAAPRPATEDQSPIPERTSVLIEAAEVLAVERPMLKSGQLVTSDAIDLRRRETQDRSTPPTVVLGVTLEQANKLHVVQGRGDVSLVTRPANDSSFVPSPKPMTLEDVLGIAPLPPSPEDQTPVTFVTEVFRGGRKDVNTFVLPPASVAALMSTSRTSANHARLNP